MMGQARDDHVFAAPAYPPTGWQVSPVWAQHVLPLLPMRRGPTAHQISVSRWVLPDPCLVQCPMRPWCRYRRAS